MEIDNYFFIKSNKIYTLSEYKRPGSSDIGCVAVLASCGNNTVLIHAIDKGNPHDDDGRSISVVFRNGKIDKNLLWAENIIRDFGIKITSFDWNSSSILINESNILAVDVFEYGITANALDDNTFLIRNLYGFINVSPPLSLLEL